jgi:hypothetical protein
MTGHGGKRAGSGREETGPPGLRISAGAWCEKRWREVAEPAAWKKHEERFPGVLAAQKRAREIPKIQLKIGRRAKEIPAHLWEGLPAQQRTQLTLLVKSIDEKLDDIGKDIEFELDHRGRQPVKLERPAQLKAQVIGEAIAFFKSNYGIAVTSYRMRRWWDEYRRFEALVHGREKLDPEEIADAMGWAKEPRS